MILSASRRTDIPNYYSDWFLNRMQEGYFYVRNPMNPRQISRIDCSREIVDCIVFWSKNPEPMIPKLAGLAGYDYYFQFTITGYGKDIEPGLPDKKRHIIPAFQELSRLLGPKRVIWRYDPILVSGRYTPEYHVKAFREIAESLKGCTDRVVISFLDLYAKIKRSMEELHVEPLPEKKLHEMAGAMAAIAAENRMSIESCAEAYDLSEDGVTHGSCIGRRLIEELIGCRLGGEKDKNQRRECGCMKSMDIGTYDTCRSGCKYCYANGNGDRVAGRIRQYEKFSPLLCGLAGPEDIITERNVRSLTINQLTLWDEGSGTC